MKNEKLIEGIAKVILNHHCKNCNSIMLSQNLGAITECDKESPSCKKEARKLATAIAEYFQEYARELVPHKKNISKNWSEFDKRIRLYTPEEVGFENGWNTCREEMLRRIETIKVKEE